MAISQIGFSQESGSPQETNLPQETEARLIDKFGNIACEDIFARQDYLFSELSKSPDSIGYVVIYGKKNSTRQNLGRENLIQGILEISEFDKERFVIIRGKESEEPHTEFWLVPASADKPNFDEVKWNQLFQKNKSRLFIICRKKI